MIQTIATCVTAFGVVVATLGLRASRRQRLRQFEMLYVQRYWTLMDQLSLAARRGTSGGPVPEGDEKVVLAYFRLCEDQLDLRKFGWISDTTWKLWSTGMEDQFQRWPFDDIWETTSSLPGFARLRECAPNRFGECQPSWWRRKFAGLGGTTTF